VIAGLAALVIAAAATAGAAVDDAARPVIEVGATTRGDLAPGPAATTVAAFALRIDGAGPVTIEARSLDFDAALRVLRLAPDGTLAEAGADDDGGAGNNALLVLEAGAETSYVIEVRPSADGGGAFEVAVSPGRPVAPGMRAGTEADLAYFEAALARAGPARDDDRVAALVLAKGWALKDLGRPADAVPVLEDALARHERRFGPAGERVATCLMVLGMARDDLNLNDGARDCYERARAIFETIEGPDGLGVAQAINNLAGLNERIGDYATARRQRERVLAIYEKVQGPGGRSVGTFLNNLGNLLQTMGEYSAARPILERALAVLEATRGPDHPRVALVLNNLGELEENTGDLAQARALYARALAIDERQAGTDHADTARDLNNLAVVLRRLGRTAEARPLYERALAILENSLGPGHPSVAVLLANLCRMLTETGDLEAAGDACRRAAATLLEPDSGTATQRARVLETMSELALARGAPAEAAAMADRAVVLLESDLGPDHPLIARALLDEAGALARAGRRDEALAASLRAEAIARAHLRLTTRALPEEEALRYASARVSGLDGALAILAGESGAAPPDRRAGLDAVIRSRAVVLDEMAARHRSAIGAADPAIAERARDAARARTRLANLLVRGPGAGGVAGYRALVDAARRESDDAERALAAASPVFGRGFERQNAGLVDVAAGLPADAALVSYVSFAGRDPMSRRPAPRYAAFVLKGDAVTFTPLGDGADVDAAVARWRRAAADGAPAPGRDARALERTYREAGRALRRLVWDPLAAPLAGARLVIIVPDGTLALVNFATLPDGDRRYLVEAGPLLHHLSAERDLLAEGGSAPAGAGLLAIGGAAFDDAGALARRAPPAAFRGRPASCAGLRALRFQPLPGTAREAAEVEAAWRTSAAGAATLLTAAGATETALKATAAGHRALHIATHGFFLGGECPAATAGTRAVAGLTGGGDPGEAVTAPPAARGENPLRLAGLALAGANRRAAAAPDEDDGILTAEEVAALDLSGLEWAVLSACDTGLGDVRAGEGVFGLRRAFRIAGARTLIMSLWSVDDAATREWMRGLYRARLRDRLDTAAAVRAASVQVLEARRRAGAGTHPFEWGAFIAAGDWR